MTEQAIHLDSHQIAVQIKQRARSLGFDLVGITSAASSHYRDYYRQWLDDGQHGTMEYLAKRFEERTDPSVYLPGAKSVICVAMNYHVPVSAPDAAGQNGDVALLKRATSPLVGRIAQYALGDDYHDLIKPRLHQLADFVRWLAPDAETRASVDTAPVMEKELAARAGIGWMGKNTCIINPHIGSWLFLGEVITSVHLPTDEPAMDRCGTCRRCIDACPTGAITDAYKLDARKCISYLTIEHRSDIDSTLQPQIGEWLYGCDICQDVCPWNGKAPFCNEGAFQPRFGNARLDLNDVQQWQHSDYSARLKGSAMKRVKLPVLQRNARIVLQNERRPPSSSGRGQG
jgi:epoxyqueuosine reductase